MRTSQGLPKRHEIAAVELLFEAFAAKFKSIIGTDALAKEAMRRSLNHDYCFYVEEEGELLGILGFQVGKNAFLDAKLNAFIDIFGFWRGISRSLKMLILHHKCSANELYIADISVSSAVRGAGIGTKLIDAAEHYAIDNGLKYLTLNVIEPNIRAKALYERMGFEVVKKMAVAPVNRILDWDFDAVYFMKKQID